MNTKLIAIALSLILSINCVSAQMQMENLNRGAIAFQKDEGVMLSWRLLGTDSYNVGFDIFRDGKKINKKPITDLTSFYDEKGDLNSKYSLKAKGKKEVEANFRIFDNLEGENAAYFEIPLNRPGQGIHGAYYTPNDGSVGDLTGNGEYDIVIKWEPTNAHDNSHWGITDNVLLDGYTMDGEHLWRIDLGPNIRAGAHYVQFLVYDFDGDGIAEIMVKTAPGTKDGTGSFLKTGPAKDTDHSIDYTNRGGYILEGEEYITVFDGQTGKELATDYYWPARGDVNRWGDGYGNRVDRFNATVAYVDGERPSAIFQRGYYTRLSMAAWDWRDNKLTRRWTFDSNDREHNKYAGQGNHSIHVIDADGDGKHDIVTGSAIIASDGKGYHTTGMGHGDATHVTYMIKDDPYPQIFMPHESGGHGMSLRHAKTGEIIFNNRKDDDIGRGVAAEIDPEVPGFHFWGTHGMGLYNMKGKVVGRVPRSMNFVIWWDGDLSRELLSRNIIEKWSIKNNRSTRLLVAEGAMSNNWTKATPVLQADLFGDWREEVILRREDNEALRVYTTTMPTKHKLYTLMHDPIYRVAISWQNSSYNQPPHPGYYIATDMDFPPLMPNIYVVPKKNNKKK